MDLMKRRGMMLSAPHLERAFGSIASFNTNYPYKIEKAIIDIDPVQNLNGYDYPYPPGYRYNLYDPSTRTDGSYINSSGVIASAAAACISDFIPVTAGKSYTWTGVSGETGDNNKRVCGYNSSKSGAQVINSVAVSGQGISYTNEFTVPDGLVYIRISLNKTDTDVIVSDDEQTLEGNICPISGWTGANVFNDPKYALTINWNQIRTDSEQSLTYDGITTSYDPQTHLFTITNNSRTTNFGKGSTQCVASSVDPIPGHRYALLGESHAGVAVSAVNVTSIRVTTSVGRIMTMTTATANTAFKIRVTKDYDFVSAHPVGDVYSFYLNIVDITQLLGEEAAATATYDQIAEMFPNDWYPYNAGEITCVSAVNGDPHQKISVNWENEAGTVYGGILDVVNEKLTITKVSERLLASWVNSIMVYKSGFASVYCKPVSQATTGTRGLRCSHLKNRNVYSYNYSGIYLYGEEYKNIGMRVPFSAINGYEDPGNSSNSVEAIKQYLTDNEVQICYTLANPIEVLLTDTPEITTLLGANNIWSDCGNVDVTFYKT